LLFHNERLVNPNAQKPAGFDLPVTNMRVIDSIHEDGAKLVEMSPDTASELRASQPGLRIVPIVYYYPAVAPRYAIAAATKTAKKVAGSLAVQVVPVRLRRQFAPMDEKVESLRTLNASDELGFRNPRVGSKQVSLTSLSFNHLANTQLEP
jgi:hypothetical protein